MHMGKRDVENDQGDQNGRSNNIKAAKENTVQRTFHGKKNHWSTHSNFLLAAAMNAKPTNNAGTLWISDRLIALKYRKKAARITDPNTMVNPPLYGFFQASRYPMKTGRQRMTKRWGRTSKDLSSSDMLLPRIDKNKSMENTKPAILANHFNAICMTPIFGKVVILWKEANDKNQFFISLTNPLTNESLKLYI